MNLKKISAIAFLLCLAPQLSANESTTQIGKYVIQSGHESLQTWLLPDIPPAFTQEDLSPDKVRLGKKLFFDPRFSGDGNMSCASCHNPSLGWSDGLPTGKGFKSSVLDRATPTIINTAYNSIQMWDGRKKDLVDQAIGPLEATVEMNANLDKVVELLNHNKDYQALFKQAYPNDPIDLNTFAKAIAAYEATIVSNNSPFDQWVAGDKDALTAEQINGFEVFVDKNKGNCAECHSGGNFTDNGFHNLGLEIKGDQNADPGRYTQRPLGLLFGAFKTPTVRESANTAPYFHDGSARTLMDVVEHYANIEPGQKGISPNLKPINLTKQEKLNLVKFMESLSSDMPMPSLPRLTNFAHN